MGKKKEDAANVKEEAITVDATVVAWTITFWTALRNFPNPPAPGGFSRIHKRLAWTSVALMVGTVVTGLMVYYFGFIAT